MKPVERRGSDSPRRELKMIIAGGCHVEGYIVGRHAGFASCLKRRLEERSCWAQITTVSLINIVDLPLIREISSRTRPDVLILQLGNYETMQLFQKLLRRTCRPNRKQRVRLHPPRIASLADFDDQIGASRPWRPGIGTRLLMAAKATADTLIGHRFLNGPRITRILAEGLDGMAALASQTILMSPLPCLDPMTSRYRRELGTLMSAAAEAAHVKYLDFGEPCVSSNDFFADHLHLGKGGHQWVADQLEALLITPCSSTKGRSSRTRLEVCA